ncbi:ferric reductase-like transmembrane domain-containing protein [Cribrihabitans sp. XS_ASV171]
MPGPRALAIWLGVAGAVLVPLGIAAGSPLLQWRQPVYVVAGFAGIAGLALLLIQPLLAGGYLPGLPVRRGRLVHRAAGAMLVLAVIVHVAGLWITSPPDMIDALTFTSPTPFSAWGVIAMWGVFAAAALALLRPRLRARVWRIGHSAAVTLVVVTTVVHAVLIEGTMGTVSKLALCLLVVAALLRVLADLRVWRLLRRRA